MEFCDKCGSRVSIDSKKENLVCQKCGFTKKIEGELYREELHIKPKKNDEKIIVKDKNYSKSTYKILHKCSYCGNNEAYVQHIPPRWGDEDQLTIYTCTKCGKGDREGFSY